MKLDGQIALTLDWTQCDGIQCREGKHWLRPGQTNHKQHDRIPAYSTDMAAAWELVEIMGQLFRSVHRIQPFEPEQWAAEAVLTTWFPDMKTFYGIGNIAPEAICNAFLAVQESQGGTTP